MTSPARPKRALLPAAAALAAAVAAATAASTALSVEKQPAPGPASPPAGDSAQPAAAPAAPARPAPPNPATLERLRAEHAALRDALFRSRARRDTLEGALLSTQLIPVLAWEGGRKHVLKQAELRLDGVRIWESGNTPPGDEPLALSPRGVPPGTHVLGVRIEVRFRDNPKLGYVSEQSFALTLPEGKKTTVEITIDEDGDPPSYNPDIEVEVSSKG
jgi:hypothetical protein